MNINKSEITRIYYELQSGESGMAHVHAVYDEVFSPYTFPGGYPIIFMTVNECDCYCADCAKDIYIMERKDFYADIHYEGDMIHCDRCNTEIWPAYMTDEQEELEEEINRINNRDN